MLAAISVIAPATAEAGTVRVAPRGEGTVLVFEATAAEDNRLVVRADAGGIVVTDAPALSAGSGCVTGSDPSQARCDAAGLTLVEAALGDGGDSASAAGLTVPVHLDGGAGDDVLTGGLGADALAGGDGRDTVDYTSRSEGVCISLSSWPDCFPGPPEGDTVGTDVERVLLGDGPDVVWSSRMDQPLEVYGGGGNDVLYVGGDDHRVYGGAGDDEINITGGEYARPSHAECGSGADSVFAWTNEYVDDDCETAVFPTYVGYEPPPDMSDRARRDMASWYINPASYSVPPPRAVGEPEGTWERYRQAYLESLEGKPLAAEAPSLELSALSGSGLAVDVRCATACAFTARLSVTRRTARRYGLKSTVLARATARRQADHARIRLRPSAAVRRRLRRASRLTVTLRVTAVEGAGGPRIDERRLTLRR